MILLACYNCFCFRTREHTPLLPWGLYYLKRTIYTGIQCWDAQKTLLDMQDYLHKHPVMADHNTPS